MQATSELEGLPAPTGRHQVGRVSFDWVDLGQAAATRRCWRGLRAPTPN
jgi:hypothetical protein